LQNPNSKTVSDMEKYIPGVGERHWFRCGRKPMPNEVECFEVGVRKLGTPDEWQSV